MKPTRAAIVLSLLLFLLGVAVARVASPPRVVITWETASEVETAGFHVYRSRSPSGDFSRVNEDLVPAEGDPLVGASYRYVDEDVVWGQGYVYRLEEVELDGTHNRYEDSVEARAGVGWLWALASGAVLAVMGALLSGLVLGHGESSSREMPSV